MPDRLSAEMLQIAAFLLKRVHQAQRAVGRCCSDGLNQLFQHILRHYAEQIPNLFVGDRIAAVRPRLFQQRERIAQAAFRHARNHGHRALLDFQIFFLSDFS